MKHMRTIFVAGALAAAMLCGALAGCTPDDANGERGFEVRVYESDQTRVLLRVMETEDNKSMYDALVALQEDGRLTFDGSESTYGFYITSVNGVAATSDNYWGVYTTLGMYEGVSYSDATWGTIEYSDTLGNTYTLASASYGASGLPLVRGEWYALAWTAVESDA